MCPKARERRPQPPSNDTEQWRPTDCQGQRQRSRHGPLHTRSIATHTRGIFFSFFEQRVISRALGQTQNLLCCARKHDVSLTLSLFRCSLLSVLFCLVFSEFFSSPVPCIPLCYRTQARPTGDGRCS